MCRQLILLAKNAQSQMIFTCEHGTMHITHQHTTICMSQVIFRQFAAFVTKGNLAALNQSGVGCVREAEAEQVEIWIGSGGLRMTVPEFFTLTDLLRDSLQRLALLPGSTVDQRSRHSWN